MNSNLGVGIIDVAIFSLFFPLNARLLWILIRNKNFSQLWAYKLIFELAVIDALLLASTLIAGLMCLTESNFDPIFSRIAIHVHTAGHEMEGLLSVVLAFNRLVVMLNLKRFNKSWIYWLLSAHACISGITCILTLDRYGTPFYNFETHEFDVVYNTSVGEKSRMLILRILLYMTISYFSMGFVCYTVITSHIIRRRKTVSPVDIRIFIQAVLPFLWLVIFKIVTNMPWVLPTDVAPYAYTFLTRTVPCSHLLSYVTLNISLRKAMFSTCRKVTMQSSTVIRASATFF